MPSVSGNSGPVTVTSGLSFVANCAIESRLFKSAATHSASVDVPPLPGAHQSFVMRGDCRSFQTIACSRPPLPRTRTFIGDLACQREVRTQRVGLAGMACQTRNPIQVADERHRIR